MGARGPQGVGHGSGRPRRPWALSSHFSGRTPGPVGGVEAKTDVLGDRTAVRPSPGGVGPTARTCAQVTPSRL